MKTTIITKRELLDLFEIHTARLEMLDMEQLTLVKFFQTNPNYRFIAKIANVNEATVARRLKKIANFICSDDFSGALSLSKDFPPDLMKIVNNYFIKGMSLRTIAKNTGISVYKINKIIKRMRNL